jgi:hypothetical protein
MFSPFLVAPGIGAVALMAFAFHPMASRPSVLAMTAAAGSIGVVGLWFGELVGWISPTMAVHGDRLSFTSPIDGIGSVPLDIALCLYAVSLVVAAALLAGSMAVLERDARRRLHVQAWQLRQLLA